MKATKTMIQTMANEARVKNVNTMEDWAKVDSPNLTKDGIHQSSYLRFRMRDGQAEFFMSQRLIGQKFRETVSEKKLVNYDGSDVRIPDDTMGLNMDQVKTQYMHSWKFINDNFITRLKELGECEYLCSVEKMKRDARALIRFREFVPQYMNDATTIIILKNTIKLSEYDGRKMDAQIYAKAEKMEAACQIAEKEGFTNISVIDGTNKAGSNSLLLFTNMAISETDEKFPDDFMMMSVSWDLTESLQVDHVTLDSDDMFRIWNDHQEIESSYHDNRQLDIYYPHEYFIGMSNRRKVWDLQREMELKKFPSDSYITIQTKTKLVIRTERPLRIDDLMEKDILPTPKEWTGKRWTVRQKDGSIRTIYVTRCKERKITLNIVGGGVNEVLDYDMAIVIWKLHCWNVNEMFIENTMTEEFNENNGKKGHFRAF